MSTLTLLPRALGRRRGSTFLLVLLAAVGVALSTTMFAVLQSVLLNPLPYRNADRLVKPWCVAESYGIDRYPFSWDNYRDYRDGVESLDQLAATRTTSFTLEGGTRPTAVSGARVTANLFPLLGLDPVQGRVFTETGGGDPEEGVALISFGLWQRLFAGSPDVIGTSIRLDGGPYTVIGVLPRHNRYPRDDTDVFIPLIVNRPPENNRAMHFLNLVGRLREGRTLAEADAEMKTLAGHLAATYPDATGELTTRVIPLKEEIVGKTRRSLGALFSAVHVLFCIAWGNVAILLLARGLFRRGELQVRAALGATRRRLLGLLLSEAGLLAGLGCLLGLAAGAWIVTLLPQIDPALLPRADEIRFTPTLVLWALGLSVAGALVFGGLPAWVVTRESGADTASSRITDRRTSRLHARLVAAQVALALPLLAASSMQWRSVQALASVNTGYSMDGALAARAALPVNQFGVQEQKRYVDRAIERLGELAGVTSVGAMSHLPLSRRQASLVTYRPDQAGESGLPNAHYRVISSGLLSTLGIPMVAGREFEPGDDESDRATVILDETLARVLFPNRDAVGRNVRLGDDGTSWEVIGVAGAAQLVNLEQEPPYTVYVPILKNLFPQAMALPSFVVRSKGSLAALAPQVRSALQQVDPRQAVLEVRPLRAQLDDWLGTRRTVSSALWVIAAAALLLAASGTYATLAVAVDRRRRETAIRAALGAAPGRLVRGVVADGLKPGIAGALAGLAICFVVGRLLVGVLYGVGGIDVPSLAGAVSLLLVSSLVACFAPARRAARENPARLLREGEV